MPQMKPMNWLILYFLINTILMMMNIMNYFINFNSIDKKLEKKKIKNMNWKW